MPTNRIARRSATVFAAAALALLASVCTAHAGSYTVSGTCGFQPWTQTGAIQVYASPDDGCPALSMAAVAAAPPGAAGGWTLNAPGGTSIVSGTFYAWASASRGWQAAIYRSGGGASGSSWLNCPGGEGCQANPGNQWISGPGYNAGAVVAHLRCNSSAACPYGAALQVDGGLAVTLQDDTAPAVTLGGGAASGQWANGSPTAAIDANDNTGIRRVQLYIDGTQVQAQPYVCDYRYPVPCGNQRASFSVTTGDVPDGRHTLTGEALDASGNPGSASQTLLVDNTPPATPLAVDVGGIGWRAQATRRLTWGNPAQRFAPITAARYSLCPAEADSSDPKVAAKAKQACVTGEKAGRDVTEISELELPKPGLWTLRLWLVDAAGNADPESAAVIGGLGYDPTPPEVAGFAEQDPSDPARVFVRASEDVSPIAGGSVEVQRRGRRVWRPLATEVRSGGITAFIDDETLRKGRYHLRAVVTNAAGLQQGTHRGTDGQVKSLRVPIRLASRLQTGRRVGKVCRGRGANRRCHFKLRRRVPVPLGRRITLRGRLTVGHRPVARQPLEIWQRIGLPGASWQPIGTVQTNERGRFRYKAAEGPARQLRFRYPGTAHVRGDNSTIALRVQAKTTIAVSRRNVINGEYVTFRGELKGQPVPAGGALVELQVRSRGKWRTFAQPRADATGAWQYQYRFETVSGGARFRFRARVRQQAGYPYATGSSRVLGVRVHGL